jgi:hypothetical protein
MNGVSIVAAAYLQIGHHHMAESVVWSYLFVDDAHQQGELLYETFEQPIPLIRVHIDENTLGDQQRRTAT